LREGSINYWNKQNKLPSIFDLASDKLSRLDLLFASQLFTDKYL
jgi:hypothetical protein